MGAAGSSATGAASTAAGERSGSLGACCVNKRGPDGSTGASTGAATRVTACGGSGSVGTAAGASAGLATAGVMLRADARSCAGSRAAGRAVTLLSASGLTTGARGAAAWSARAGAAMSLRLASGRPCVRSSARGRLERSASTSAGCCCGRASAGAAAAAGVCGGLGTAGAMGPVRSGAFSVGTASTAGNGGASSFGTGGACKSDKAGPAGKPESKPRNTAPCGARPACGAGCGRNSGALGLDLRCATGKVVRGAAARPVAAGIAGLTTATVSRPPVEFVASIPWAGRVWGACKRMTISLALAAPAGRPPPPSPTPCCVPTSKTNRTCAAVASKTARGSDKWPGDRASQPGRAGASRASKIEGCVGLQAARSEARRPCVSPRGNGKVVSFIKSTAAAKPSFGAQRGRTVWRDPIAVDGFAHQACGRFLESVV